MRKRFRVALAILVVAGLGAIAFHRNEPSYEGKDLSDWIVTMREEPLNAEAHAVVRQLGNNSIPVLLTWLRKADRPTMRGRFERAKEGVTAWLERRKVIESRPRSYYLDFKSSYRALGNAALSELGPAGKEAIPPLIQMLSDKSPDPTLTSESAGAAYLILPRMAPESIQPLIQALSSHDIQVWTLAAGALGNIGPDAKAAIPVLEKRLQDNDADIRVNAAATLGKLGGDPREFVPVIIQSLPEADFDRLDYRLEVLLRYKEQAQAAVPVLINLLNTIPNSTNTTNMIARNQIMGALREINPGAAARTAIK
ncbi:MAG: hypothetical protein JWQ04_2099 [Pedosphaera sp.]|nr:hypothetical protein [Pedosphaera sp.]